MHMSIKKIAVQCSKTSRYLKGNEIIEPAYEKINTMNKNYPIYRVFLILRAYK